MMLPELPEGVLIAGVDEVGRGPLAGPVVTAAVILDPDNPITGLADSKRLTERRREQLAREIRLNALCWSLGRAEVEEIDRINIFQATMLAMRRAVEGLSQAPGLVLIDGKHAPQLPYECRTLVKGDTLVPAISAASILAKVSRDAEMVTLDEQYPGYDFARHKGYPTRHHLACLAAQGVSEIHRRSYAPVRRLLPGDDA